jgi:hypothetical protein
MDRYVHAICSCFSIAVAETSVNKQSGLSIHRDHTLHIQCGNVTHYADGWANRGLIREDIDGSLPKPINTNGHIDV